MSDPKKELAKSKYVAGEEIVAIAEAIGVDRKTIQRWIKASEGTDTDWRKLREANETTKTPKPPKLLVLPQRKEPVDQHVRQRPRTEGMTDLEIIETAIADLYASLPNADDKSKGGMAATLVKLIEFKQKLNPPTIEEFADQIIDRLNEWNLSPRDLAVALKQRQEGRKRA